MAGTPAYRPSGPTLALSVDDSSHDAVAVVAHDNQPVNWVACINPGALAVAVRFSQSGATATLPIDGTPGDFVLPGLMESPIVIPCPPITPQVTAIGSAAGPTIIYLTPIDYLS